VYLLILIVYKFSECNFLINMYDSGHLLEVINLVVQGGDNLCTIFAVCFREQVEDLQKEIQKIEADYRRQVGVTTPVLKKQCITKCVFFV